MNAISSYTDEDFRRTIWSALKLVAIATALGIPLLWWKAGGATALLFLVGALISGTSLFEWLRLMTAVMVRMDVQPELPAPVKPLAPVLIGFFLRLAVALVLLYVSLKFLNGSVYALVAGLALGVAALSVEGLRLVKNWTT